MTGGYHEKRPSCRASGANISSPCLMAWAQTEITRPTSTSPTPVAAANNTRFLPILVTAGWHAEHARSDAHRVSLAALRSLWQAFAAALAGVMRHDPLNYCLNIARIGALTLLAMTYAM